MATILLVEDEASMRLLTCAKLKHQFTIICAKDGVEALELLERQPVDLIIADVMMPRMDGYTLVPQGPYRQRAADRHRPGGAGLQHLYRLPGRAGAGAAQERVRAAL